MAGLLSLPCGVLVATALLLAGCAGPTPFGSDPALPRADGAGPTRPGSVAGLPDGTATAGSGGGQPAHTEEYVLTVDGQPARGLLGVPAGDPTTLVVVAHAWGASAETHRVHLQRFAERGVLAVAMDYRGAQGDFKVRAGAEDTVAATLDLQARYPSVDRTLVAGHSMGGGVALLAVAPAAWGTYDYAFAGAGVSDLAALWRTYVTARPAIEAETGGTPDQVPDEYRVRSPLHHVDALREKGVLRYFLVHGAADAPVPLDQSEHLYEGMWDADLEVSFYVVTTDDDPMWCVPETGVCPAPMPASHSAGRLELLRPFLDHRVERRLDPWGAVRGTYDGHAGTYRPSDIGAVGDQVRGTLDGPPGAQVLHYNGSFEWAVSGVWAGGRDLYGVEDTRNCMVFDDAVRILRGSARIAWDDGVGRPPMELALWGRDGDIVRAVGDVRIHLDLSGLTIAPFEWPEETMLVWQLASEPGPAVASEARGILWLDLDYVPLPDAFAPDAQRYSMCDHEG